jgi:Ion channel
MAEPQASNPEAAAPSPPAAPPRHIGFRRFSTAEFLLALALLFIGVPIAEGIPGGENIEAALTTLVLVSGVLAVGRSRRTLVWAAVLMVPAVTAKWMNHFWPDLVPKGFYYVIGLIFLIFLVAQFLRFILRAPRVNSEVMCAGISVYLLLGLSWMLAYLIVASSGDPKHPAFAFNAGPPGQSMDGFIAYYFSFVTLTTVGYGDITPVSNGARALAAMESMTGTLYVAVLISRLVALYSSQSRKSDPQEHQGTDNKESTTNQGKL